MYSKQPHPVNLKQYRKVSGKWQFAPVARYAKRNPILALSSRMGSLLVPNGVSSILTSAKMGNVIASPLGHFPRKPSKPCEAIDSRHRR